ncbi:MAG: YdcF family protein [Oleispira sp.]|nr:YdcF family protein [Oleispira sp.]MBL4880084.1 YdcF family protein [Oleispira sp.]
MDHILHVVKELVQMPIFWLVISVCMLFIYLLFGTVKQSALFLFVTFFWYLSITPLGTSMWLGSLILIDGTNNDCIKKDINALIILPGGLSWRPNDGEDKLSDWSIDRAKRALELLKDNNVTQVILPGGIGKGAYTEAELLKRYIESEVNDINFDISGSSFNTYENLETIRAILKKQAYYYLVTSYWHMPRAKRVAEKLSIKVCPIVTEFDMKWSLIPSFEAHWHSKAAMHEWLGLAWYRIKGKI